MLKLYLNNDHAGFVPINSYRADLVSMNYHFPSYNFETFASLIEINEENTITYLNNYNGEIITRLTVVDETNDGNKVIYDRNLTNGVIIAFSMFSGMEDDGNFITRYSLTIEDRNTALPNLDTPEVPQNENSGE